jgi:hypothetical protein
MSRKMIFFFVVNLNIGMNPFEPTKKEMQNQEITLMLDKGDCDDISDAGFAIKGKSISCEH